MGKSNIKSAINNIGIPRLIIIGFFFILCGVAFAKDMNVPDLLSNTLIRTGQNGILVLAMVPAILCGIGLNFGIAIGIVGGILGGLISIELGLAGWSGLIVAILIGIVISAILGFFYGLLLNRVKGSEMTVSTYVGFSVIALMNIGWLLLPFKHPAIKWPIGDGLRNTVAMDDSFGLILNQLWEFKLGSIVVPTGSLLFLAISCLLMKVFLNSKIGLAMTQAGSNPRFARANGIDIDKMRVLGTVLSTVVSAVGIIIYAQSYGFFQLYNAPLTMSFAAVAAVLIGGASLKRAKVSHVIIGVFLFQAIISMGLPVFNAVLVEGNLSEVMRLIISNGIILYSLTKSEEVK